MALNPFAGFEYDKPSDIQLLEDRQMQQAMASGDRNVMRGAIFSQLGNQMAGGSQAYKKAKKTQDILNRAGKGIDPDDDSIENQISYMRQAQKMALDADLPEIAMQATANLAQLQTLNEERSRLKSAETRADAKLKIDQEAHEAELRAKKLSNLENSQGVVIDTSQSPPKIIEQFDLLGDPAKTAEIIQKAREEGFQIQTMGQFVELTEAEKDRANRLKDMAKTAGVHGRSNLYDKFLTKSQATHSFAVTADDFVDLLMRNDAQQIFGAGGETKGFVENAAAHVRSFLDPQEMESIDKRFREARGFNALSGEKQAIAIELGFALAASREPGKLTDQDVDRAIRTLALDNPDPAAVAWIFGRALLRTRKTYAEALTHSGVSDLPIAQKSHADALAALDLTIDRLKSKYGNLDFESEEQFDNLVGAPNLGPTGVRVRQPEKARGGNRRVRDLTGD